METRKKRVLVADDNPGIRTVMRSVLDRQCLVVEAEDGSELEEVLGKHSFDLVIANLNMPSKHGILSLIGGGKGKPTLLITGKDERDDEVVRARRMVNVIDVFPKPLDLETLLRRAGEVIGDDANAFRSGLYRNTAALASLPTVLVVDDDPDVCDLMTDILETAGCQVRTSTSCEEALEICRSANYNLIMLDYMLDDGMGNEFLENLASISDGKIASAVLVLSGFADCLDQSLFKGFECVKGFLAKPVKRDQILEQASKAMGLELPRS